MIAKKQLTSTFHENSEKLRLKTVCKFINLINQLTIFFLNQYRPFNGENIKEKENTSII